MEKPGSEKFNILLRTKLFSIEIIKLCDVLNKKKLNIIYEINLEGVEHQLAQICMKGNTVAALWNFADTIK